MQTFKLKRKKDSQEILVIKISIPLLILYFVTGCSIHDATGFWSKQKKIEEENLEFKKLFQVKEIKENEFNTEYEINIDLNDSDFNKNYRFDNNDGFIIFNDKLEKISKFNFSKIKNFDKIETNLIFHNQKIIFFDNKGTILCFDQNSELLWSFNIYSKEEKKIGPLLTFNKKNNLLFIADNLARYYSIDIDTGKLIWDKKHTSSFNSEIKTFKNRIYIVDAENTLNSFLIKDGTKVWSHFTEKSFINSIKKLSIVFNKEKVIFNNSTGNITALNARDGKLLWQSNTFNSKSYEDLMNLKTSNLIINNNSLYFSNNKNEFYSLDVETGLLNWQQNINSYLKPVTIGDFVLTFSHNGFQYLIEKNSGNIIKITDIFYQFNDKERKKLFITGFILNKENIFISTSSGKLLVMNISDSKIIKVIKVDKGIISRAFVNNENMYIVKDNAIIKLN